MHRKISGILEYKCQLIQLSCSFVSIARKFNQCSSFGSMLDMVTDRCSTLGLLFILYGEYGSVNQENFGIYRMVRCSFITYYAMNESILVTHSLTVASTFHSLALFVISSVGYLITLVPDVFYFITSNPSQIKRRKRQSLLSC